MLTATGETRVLFVVGVLNTMQERQAFHSWLIDNAGMDAGQSRAVALTGEGLPCLLSVTKFQSPKDLWPDQLREMGVPIQLDTFACTDEPLEAVYVTGRAADQREHAAKRARALIAWWEKQDMRDGMSLLKASRIMIGNAPAYITCILVHNTRDREPIREALAEFGLTQLEFVDIQNPWVD